MGLRLLSGNQRLFHVTHDYGKLCNNVNVICPFSYSASLFIVRTQPLSVIIYNITPLSATFLVYLRIFWYNPKYISIFTTVPFTITRIPANAAPLPELPKVYHKQGLWRTFGWLHRGVASWPSVDLRRPTRCFNRDDTGRHELAFGWPPKAHQRLRLRWYWALRVGL